MGSKYQMPAFLGGIQKQSTYERWLQRKAAAHIRRDRRRGNTTATQAEYKEAIHGAICESEGVDAYTGENLDWSLISKYNNEASKAHRREYKKKFGMLPSVDHVGDGTGPADFRICGWRTNDCKNDLNLDELLAFCQLIIEKNRK